MLKIYIKGKLAETLRVVSSVISKCKKAQSIYAEGVVPLRR